ncbi:PH domain-containing protein [Streptomyces sp. TRM43335]|uniref:PH domain-containing protein n=1 Tax=Streptomyces taklimakanensis TaxID=2569853 RepID=A0A6G2BJB7_9ACTN|nr:PH domain-containing protein [Streptomyces taklimakanensis]MTE22375.1 PH domain-containing protein [Streptomyces taklimakanensis]
MIGDREVICRPLRRRALWCFVALGAAGAGSAVARLAYRGEPLDVWLGVGLLLSLVGVASLHSVTARVSADTHGLRSRTLARRRSVSWRDVADLRVHLRYADVHRTREIRRVGLALRDGRKRLLPLPQDGWICGDPDFDAKLDALRALHRRYGTPKSSHVPVVSYRTAGRGWVGSLALCALLLACAGVAAWSVPSTASNERAWKSATPCTDETPAAERGECLTTLPAVIERTEAERPRQRGRLYFADGRPLERLTVSREAARAFRPGDSVELTFWRSRVREVAGERHVWRDHVPGAGSSAVAAAVCVLAAGYPGAQVLLRLRGRRLPDDEVLPSALPFAGALVGTALWLVPFCFLHPTAPLASPVAITWVAAGSLATLGLFAWAWRATRVRAPGTGEDGVEGKAEEEDEGRDVYLAARFLEHTDYNPYGFGTHIVLGGGPPAVTPHHGPGRFAAKRIPVERLALKDVRRPRGDDGDTVPGNWHVAEIDDAGTPVRLAAAPADLARVLRALDLAATPANTTSRAP